MKLTKEAYIHNRLIFEENEKDTLWLAAGIIDAVRDNNACSGGATDTHLREICDSIFKGISELLDNYSNEYPNR